MRRFLICLGGLARRPRSRRPARTPRRVRPAAVAAQARAVPGQARRSGPVRPQAQGLFLPEGFKLEIVVDDPDIVNPVGMTFGPDGTLYVMEWRPDPVTQDRWFEVKETFRYRDGTTRQVATMKKFTTDLVKAVQVQPGDRQVRQGRDHHRRGTALQHPLPRRLALRHRPRHRAARWQAVAGPGGPWDVREIIAQGFCGFHHHQVSGLTIGNDGLLYITSGDDDNFVEGSDGSRATVLRTGAVFRCKPDGSKMEDVLARLPQPVPRPRLRRQVQLVPRRQRQRGRQQVHGLPAHARRRGHRLRLAAADRGAVLPAGPRPRGRRRRVAGQGAADAQDRPRLPGRAADLPRHAPARAVPRAAVLPGRVPQAGPGLQGRAGRVRRSRSPTSSSSSRATTRCSARARW